MSTGSETGALAMGAQMAFGNMDHLPAEAQRWVGWLGAKEALYNFDLACGFGAVAALVATIAPRRTVASAP